MPDSSTMGDLCVMGWVKGAQAFPLLYAADKTINDDSKTKTAFGAMSDMQTTGGMLAANLSAGNANAAKWQSDNCVALTSAACETNFQFAAAQGQLLKAERQTGFANQLANVLGGTFSGPHQYANTGVVCASNDIGCTSKNIYSGLLMFPAPGMISNGLPVTSGSVSLASFPVIGGLGYVAHLTDPSSKSIANITLPSQHGLDPGFVVRSVVQNNGQFNINTYGGGTGALAYINGLQPIVDFVWGGNVATTIKPFVIPPKPSFKPGCINSAFSCN